MSKEMDTKSRMETRASRHQKRKQNKHITYIGSAVLVMIIVAAIPVFSSSFGPLFEKKQVTTQNAGVAESENETGKIAKSTNKQTAVEQPVPAKQVVDQAAPKEVTKRETNMPEMENSIPVSEATNNETPTQVVFTGSQGQAAPTSARPKAPKRIMIHEVKPKETLFSITMLYFSSSVSQQKIAAYNGIKNVEQIHAGMTLKIPDPEYMFDHSVKKGETLLSITRKYYGKDEYFRPLAKFNGIKNLNHLPAGTKIRIPNGYIFQKRAASSTVKPTATGYSIVIKKKTNQLVLYQNGKRVKTFAVGTGKDTASTPVGSFRIVNHLEKPWYRAKGIRGGDPKNPLGSHWLGLDVPGTDGTTYGIHGTNNPASIGKHISLGCVRMHNNDVEYLYEKLPLYTPVSIVW